MEIKLRKRLIYAGDLWHKTFVCEEPGDFRKAIENAPSVDAVEVVRCKDCKHSYDGVANLMCGRCGQHINGIRLGGVSVKEEHFCSYGERKDNG